MTAWIWRAIRTGIKSMRYPDAREHGPGLTPGLPIGTTLAAPDEARAVAETCPTGALAAEAAQVRLAAEGRCVDCFRCARREGAQMAWRADYEWARFDDRRMDASALSKSFGRSLHVFVVDAGDCGACLSEVAQLAGPYYNAHRLGIFVTPTPRHADVMVVVGPVTDHMSDAVRRCYDAMPEPKRVIAVGACALSGGVFGPSFASRSGAADVVPVDVVVPGCPPPPLAILHALLVVTGRARPAESAR